MENGNVCLNCDQNLRVLLAQGIQSLEHQYAISAFLVKHSFMFTSGCFPPSPSYGLFF